MPLRLFLNYIKKIINPGNPVDQNEQFGPNFSQNSLPPYGYPAGPNSSENSVPPYGYPAGLNYGANSLPPQPDYPAEPNHFKKNFNHYYQQKKINHQEKKKRKKCISIISNTILQIKKIDTKQSMKENYITKIRNLENSTYNYQKLYKEIKKIKYNFLNDLVVMHSDINNIYNSNLQYKFIKLILTALIILKINRCNKSTLKVMAMSIKWKMPINKENFDICKFLRQLLDNISKTKQIKKKINHKINSDNTTTIHGSNNFVNPVFFFDQMKYGPYNNPQLNGYSAGQRFHPYYM